MSLCDLYYFSKNIYWVTATAGQIIPNWMWGAYHIYRVTDSVLVNTAYVTGKISKYYYGDLDKSWETRVLLVTEDDDFVIIS
jgi:hypothetical protein